MVCGTFIDSVSRDRKIALHWTDQLVAIGISQGIFVACGVPYTTSTLLSSGTQPPNIAQLTSSYGVPIPA